LLFKIERGWHVLVTGQAVASTPPPPKKRFPSLQHTTQLRPIKNNSQTCLVVSTSRWRRKSWRTSSQQISLSTSTTHRRRARATRSCRQTDRLRHGQHVRGAIFLYAYLSHYLSINSEDTAWLISRTAPFAVEAVKNLI